MKYLLSIILLSLLFLPAISLAVLCNGEENGLNLCYPSFGPDGFTLTFGADLNQVVAWFYYFVVGISGLAAFVMLVVGGFRWLTSAGNPTTTSDAKDQITKALLGLLLILMSWIILQVINPDLTILTGPSL